MHKFAGNLGFDCDSSTSAVASGGCMTQWNAYALGGHLIGRSVMKRNLLLVTVFVICLVVLVLILCHLLIHYSV